MELINQILSIHICEMQNVLELIDIDITNFIAASQKVNLEELFQKTREALTIFYGDSNSASNLSNLKIIQQQITLRIQKRKFNYERIGIISIY